MNHQKQFVPALSFTTACRRYRVKQAWAECSSVAVAVAARLSAAAERFSFLKWQVPKMRIIPLTEWYNVTNIAAKNQISKEQNGEQGQQRILNARFRK